MPNNSIIIAILGVISLLCSPYVVASNRLLKRLFLPPSLTGPDSLAFDNIGEGPYSGASDGRILKYDEPNSCFIEFAYISPDRYACVCYPDE